MTAARLAPPDGSYRARHPVKADIEARPRRVFGKRVFPNLVLRARQQERVELRNPDYGLTP